ncbi:hypothetical protein [Leptolyngbya sp. FACHB-16]|uniref:hypothetical protein n=2 Tax=Leptolyngbya TaxID=47251 RepID=UPI0019CC0C5B|nr:hypothetical protein [Leptolyngbya sp. FACHB-16]MBD2157939.1 hypothetical protein [Leptolyngbya sp. FACHB-16]
MKVRLPQLFQPKSISLTRRSSLRRYRWLAIALTTSILVSFPWAFSRPVSSPSYLATIEPWFATAPVSAQLPAVNIADTARVLYERLPFLPLENQYVNNDGNTVPESTLLTRLMFYHTGVQQRQPYFRLDWKLTLADYLGANETMHPDTYPNSRNFRDDPMQGDIAAVRNLSREQREQLVDTIVTLLNPLAARASSSGSAQEPTGVNTSPASPSRPNSGVPTATPREPQPGDAQLLLP